MHWNLIRSATALSTLVVLGGCAVESSNVIAEQPALGDKADGAAKSLLVVDRIPADRDGYVIRETRMDGSMLEVDVSYGGGCAAHDFELYWDGSFLESLPQQVELRLVHDGHGDACEAYLSETLRFDLADLASPDRLIVHVSGHDQRSTVTFEPAVDPVKPLIVVSAPGWRRPPLGDAVRLEDARLEGHKLSLDVSFGGGCQEHDFELYWDGRLLETFPAQAHLFMTHDAHRDACRAIVSQTLEFDITELAASAPVSVSVAAQSSTIGFEIPAPAPASKPLEVVDAFPADKDGFSLSAARMDGDVVELDVGYGGGCATHDFTLFWDGRLLETFPAQARLRLVHDGHGDACEAFLSETLRFDLSTIAATGRTRVSIGGAGGSANVEVGR